MTNLQLIQKLIRLDLNAEIYIDDYAGPQEVLRVFEAKEKVHNEKAIVINNIFLTEKSL